MALKIISVKVVRSREINRSWLMGTMQIIETDRGTLYDNGAGTEYSFKGGRKGYDWKPYEGKTISGFRITHDSGLDWLKQGR